MDGGAPIDVDLTSAVPVIAPIFTSGLLTPGSHTIMLRVTNGNVALDRFVVGLVAPSVREARNRIRDGS